MNFFSGFCFQGEKELFGSFAPLDLHYTLSGFSYGAILAFEETLKRLKLSKRVQTLNLFSPAFFQTQKTSFLKAQILGFKKDSQRYIQNFLLMCGNPSKQYFKEGTLQELETLLYYQWKEEDLQFVIDCGVKINIFIGGKDNIIPPQETCRFFTPFGIVYFYKDFNHCLQCDHL